MPISTQKERAIVEAHALGLLDQAIADRAGVSLSTVKLKRKALGLSTNSATAQLGKLGEALTLGEAQLRGFTVRTHDAERDPYDLVVAGQLVDVKTAVQSPDGSWRFRLPEVRPSFGGNYHYKKDYAQSCDLIALVAVYPDGQPADFYLLTSHDLPASITIRLGGRYEAIRNDWSLLEQPVQAMPV